MDDELNKQSQNVDLQTQAQEKTKRARKKQENTADLEETKETGGPKGLEPTRYGDWEVAGRCTDF